MSDVRVSLYSKEFEPIAVLRVPQGKLEHAKSYGSMLVKLPLGSPYVETSMSKFEAIALEHVPVSFNGKQGSVLVTDHQKLIDALKEIIPSGDRGMSQSISSEANELVSQFFQALIR